jgi:ribosome-associated translation inhibitor RaiA
MKPANDRPGPRTQIDTHQCELSRGELDQIQADLDALSPQVANFPVADFHVLVEFNNRSNDYSVKTSLVLPGATLVGNDHDSVVHAAFLRCLQSLAENIRAYKDRLGNVEEQQKLEKGTHQPLAATQEPDFAAIGAAVRDGDYTGFRAATIAYEDAARRRAGRWVERVPEVQAQIGRGLNIDDIVEAVFLEAFEAYDRRPRGVRFGDWLDGLIDPAVKALRVGGDYLENVRLARSAREVPPGSAAVLTQK